MRYSAPSPFYMEEIVLGAILIDGSVFGIVKESLEPGDFFDEKCRQIYDTMCRLSSEGQPVDIPMIATRLMNAPIFTHDNIVEYLFDLQSELPSPQLIQVYVDKVKDRSKLEHAKEIMFEANQVIDRTVEDVDTTLLDISDKIAELTMGGKKPWCDGVDAIQTALSEAVLEAEGSRPKLNTGFTSLDQILGGVRGGSLNIIAARPAMGKTAFAINMMMNCIQSSSAINQCLFFSLEMSAAELGTRILSQMARVDSKLLKNGRLQGDDWERLFQFSEQFQSLYRDRITIDDTPALEVGSLVERAKHVQKTKGVSFIIVDYLQLLRNGDKRLGNREQEIASISRNLKALAKTLNVPVFALAQLNRSVEKREDKRPGLADLRESGSIEQDADSVMFLHREEKYNPKPENANLAEVIVAKHRSGPTGTASLHWEGKYTQFSNLETESRF